MFLKSVKVSHFKSINTIQTIQIDDEVTAFVGMNEAGKTVFFQALQKSNDAFGLANFDLVHDYPRKDLTTYRKQHDTNPAEVTKLTYQLTDDEVNEINDKLNTEMESGFTFSISHLYNNNLTIGVRVDERPVIKSLIESSDLSSETTNALKEIGFLRDIPEAIKNISPTENDKAFLNEIQTRIAKAAKWESVIAYEVWNLLSPKVPKFLYFSDYELLPSKINLQELAQRVAQAKSEPKSLNVEHRAVLALLRMADISITDLTKTGGYETLKAKIESISIKLTDQIMEFWKQNEDLDVEIDIKPDPEDEAPYNNGTNLYLRIKNRRHRGVSTDFRQRSRGFIWFFSFLVWFDSVQHQLDRKPNSDDRELILLLDEPGLSLHAMAQKDFLGYIDNLSERHQVLYTTHSPFMIHSDRLDQVRIVEDRDKVGTIITDNVLGSDSRTIFPLQAALGWNMAQNLFISERNLLVEGPSDLLYLKAISHLLEAKGQAGLRDDITIVPAGGLDKVATFISLLGANGLKLVVFHDFSGTPEQRLDDLVHRRIVDSRVILNASQFRDIKNIGKSSLATDTEDLLSPTLYLDCFNKVFVKQLSGTVIDESILPPGDRIICRIEQYLKTAGIQIRPSGGFNHYTVALQFSSQPPKKLDNETQKRFEALFVAINTAFERPSAAYA